MSALPLQGKRILNTRPAHQAGELSSLLDARGGVVVEFPVLEIQTRVDVEQLAETVDALQDGDWIACTSANAVRALFPPASDEPDSSRTKALWRHIHDRFQSFSFAAIGEQTKRALVQHGVQVGFVSPDSNASRFGEAFIKFVASMALEESPTVLFLHGALFEPGFVEALRGAKFPVLTQEVYAGVLPELSNAQKVLLRQLIQSPPESTRRCDVVLFASAQTARNFVALAEQALETNAAEVVGLLRDHVIGVLGPKTAIAVAELGLRVDVTAENASASGLVDALCHFYNSR